MKTGTDETPPTLEDLTKQLEDLTARDNSRQQQTQATAQQLQQKLQQESATVINTMGQITMLGDLLKAQVAAMNRTEGMLQMLQSMQ